MLPWASPLRSTNFEKVLEVGAEEDIEPQAPAHAVVILDADALVADRLPKELGAFYENRVPRQLIMFTKRDVWIGQIHGESRLVLVHDGAQEKRSLALDPQLVMRQVACRDRTAPLPCPGWSRYRHSCRARESLAVLQGAQRTIDQGGVRLDVVFGPDVRVADPCVASGSPGASIMSQVPFQITWMMLLGESRIARTTLLSDSDPDRWWIGRFPSTTSCPMRRLSSRFDERCRTADAHTQRQSFRAAVNRASKQRRTGARLMARIRSIAETASSIESTRPENPSSITSGAEPCRRAITGVPVGIASSAPASTMPVTRKNVNLEARLGRKNLLGAWQYACPMTSQACRGPASSASTVLHEQDRNHSMRTSSAEARGLGLNERWS